MKALRHLKNNKGSSIFEWVVVIAVVAIIAILVAPKVQTGIEARADTTIERVNDLETIMKKK
jgi:Tfp pilus assembly protein FimT